jgi:yersiniabactin nonribosomal peptide/polyketide synthase
MSARRADAAASGAMVAVFAQEEALMPLARRSSWISPPTMARNIRYFPPEARLAEFCAALSQHDINYRRLSVTGAAHSALLEPYSTAFRKPARAAR